MMRISTLFRSPAFVAVALVLGAAGNPLYAQSGSLFDISIANGWGTTEFANGDKVVRGRMNTLHFVWEDGGLIKYSSSNDGISWTTTELVAPGLSSALPAITSDSNGTLVVAFVGNPNSDGIGTIEVARKEWGSSSWTYQTVVNSGTQPDVQAKGGKVHLVWTTIARVQYTQFQTTSLPAPMDFGEEVEISGCEGTGFLQPSVALTREDCDLTVKLGYLRFSDERTNPDTNCVSLITEVGPRICSRDLAGVWTLEWDDLTQAIDPAQGIEAISFSMNANYTGAHVFAAWSDATDGVERTMIAHGKNGAWSAEQHSSIAHHIHVAANPRSSTAGFRLAWSRRWLFGFPPFADVDASYRTGAWPAGASPTWDEPTPIQLNVSQGGGVVERPHAVYWYKCSLGSYDTVEAIGLFETACDAPAHRSHMHLNEPCPPPTGIIVKDCWEPMATVKSHASSMGLEIDYGDLGAPYVVRPQEILFRQRMAGRTVYSRMRWTRGRIVDSWEGGMRIDDASASFYATSPDLSIRLEQLDRSELYRGAKVKDVCRR